MKTIKSIFIGMVLFLANAVQAQVSVNVNIGSPPQWGPVGYTEVRYYYLPDVEAYYDIETSMFIYFGGGAWIHRTYLPTRYSSYDLYSGYKVVMTDYRGNAPYANFKEYKKKYAKGYRGSAQKTIGQKPGRGNSKASPNNGNNNKGQGNNKGNAPHNNAKGNSGHGGGNGKKK